MTRLDLFAAILTFFFGTAFVYLLKKQVDRLGENERGRIMDLLVIGFLLNYFGFLESVIWEVKQQELSLAGMIVFAYGFSMLIYKSFKQGLELINENKKSKVKQKVR